MAAVCSRVIYGSYQWRRRTLKILLVGALGVPIAIILFVAIPVALLAWAADVSMILLAVLLPVVLGGLVFAVYWCLRNNGKWGVQAEAARWLAQRHSETSPRERAWHSRGIRFALCIPFLTVLPFFLFLPETWGILSHLGQRDSGNLSGYRVTIPATWIVLYHQEEADGRSWVYGITGKGIGRGNNPFRYDSLSDWQVRTTSFSQSEMTDYDRWPPKENDIVSRHPVNIGNESLTCLDYWPSYDWGPARSESTTIAHVTCGGSGRLRATFDGPRSQLPVFYRTISGITPQR
jgi:hypothetical protein